MSNRNSFIPPAIATVVGILISTTSALVDLGHKSSAPVVFWFGISLIPIGLILLLVQWRFRRTPKGKTQLLPSGTLVSADLACAILQNTKDNLQVDEYDRAGCSEEEFSDCIEVLAQDGYLEARNEPTFQTDNNWFIRKITPKGKALLANLNKQK